MADLEHNVPNTPETVFEPGSVAKQFTAASTILLALDGNPLADIRNTRRIDRVILKGRLIDPKGKAKQDSETKASMGK